MLTLDDPGKVDFALKRAFGEIDGTTRSHVNEDKVPGLSKESFQALLLQSSSQLSAEGAATFFDLLDVDDDGVIYKHELKATRDGQRQSGRVGG